MTDPDTSAITYVSHFRLQDLLHLVLELASHVRQVCFLAMGVITRQSTIVP